MGVTEGEPNGIVYLQRPLWTAFTQGSRDASGLINPALNGDPTYTNCLTDILNKTRKGADGEIRVTGGFPVQDATYGYLTFILDDTAAGAQSQRSDAPPVLNPTSFATAMWNSIVPINVYNVREGRINSGLSATTVYERGVTNVTEINMRNLARWLDGVFNNNLLAGTNATSNFVGSPDGYTVYVSDRRGDKDQHGHRPISHQEYLRQAACAFRPGSRLEGPERKADKPLILSTLTHPYM